MFSSEAVDLFLNESLDWIYIDARHDYTGVSEDLRLYWPKLRPGMFWFPPYGFGSSLVVLLPR